MPASVPKSTKGDIIMKAYKLTTEGDCEGRSTKELGIFIGTPEQIVQYAQDNNIKKYYQYALTPIDIIDVTNVTTDKKVNISSYGTVTEM